MKQILLTPERALSWYNSRTMLFYLIVYCLLSIFFFIHPAGLSWWIGTQVCLCTFETSLFPLSNSESYRSRLPLRYFWVSLNDRSEFQIIDFVRLFVYSRHTPPSSDSTYHRIGESIRVFPAPNHQCWTTGRTSPQCNRKESVTPHVPTAGTEPGLPAP